MKRDNDQIRKEKIRKYRRLRRKAKRFQKQRAILRFFFNKILPFTLFQFFLKKYKFSWIPLILSILVLFYNSLNNFSTEQFRIIKRYEIEIRETKKELQKLKLFIDQQNLTITDLQNQVFNWSKNYEQLVQTNEQNSENFKKAINKLNQAIEKYQAKNQNLLQEKIKMEFDFKERFNSLQHQFQKENLEQTNCIDQLKLEITAKNNELELKQLQIEAKQSEIEELKEKLQNQESEFSQELQKIRTDLTEISTAISDIKVQNRIKLVSVFIDTILRNLKF